MAIIRLKQQQSYRFEYTATLGVGHINYGKHLGNDALVTLLHDARLVLFKGLGATELDLGDGQTGTIMNELAVNYRAEGKLLDEVTVHSDFSRIKTASFQMNHLVTRGDDIIAVAEVGLVTYNYDEASISPIPENFRARIE
jgi:acyl-CoA thioesterase FadM